MENIKMEKTWQKKIDALLEQNKTFAKGIAMMYEKPSAGEQISQETQTPQIFSSAPQMPAGFEGYQRSIGVTESEQILPESKFKMKQ